MGKKLYVGNLPYSVTSESLADMFAPFGSVDSSKIVMDRDTNRSKGFGFVEMSNDDEAQAAIEKLNGSDCSGRSMIVNEARPVEKREGGSRGGFNRGGGHRGGNRENGGNRW